MSFILRKLDWAFGPVCFKKRGEGNSWAGPKLGAHLGLLDRTRVRSETGPDPRRPGRTRIGLDRPGPGPVPKIILLFKKKSKILKKIKIKKIKKLILFKNFKFFFKKKKSKNQKFRKSKNDVIWLGIAISCFLSVIKHLFARILIMSYV